jgi:hypothetical protein
MNTPTAGDAPELSAGGPDQFRLRQRLGDRGRRPGRRKTPSGPSSWAPGRTARAASRASRSIPGGGAQLKYTMAYYHLPSGQRVKSRSEVEKEGDKDWGVGAPRRGQSHQQGAARNARRPAQQRRAGAGPIRIRRRCRATSAGIVQTLKADPQLAMACSSPGPS